ncbi:hypothetical protein [Roseivivax halotolerans]|uniref:hypothetical protein n=1 Tax=Roseivivax halotolerans TaxID=93684 RepID=UPI001587BC85|nr:hypothetical protein [Roseivivax halotolerans]
MHAVLSNKWRTTSENGRAIFERFAASQRIFVALRLRGRYVEAKRKEDVNHGT